MDSTLPVQSMGCLANQSSASDMMTASSKGTAASSGSVSANPSVQTATSSRMQFTATLPERSKASDRVIASRAALVVM